MPGSMREKVAAIIALEMLVQGSFFKSNGIRRRLPLTSSLVTNVLQSLVNSGVITKTSTRGKFMFTNEFFDML